MRTDQIFRESILLKQEVCELNRQIERLQHQKLQIQLDFEQAEKKVIQFHLLLP